MQNSKMWLLQIESRFVMSRITDDETKFYHFIGRLDGDMLAHVPDILEKLPTNNRYKNLKKLLIEHFFKLEEKT